MLGFQYVEAPNDLSVESSYRIFLAGGITDCPDWQADMVAMLDDKIGYSEFAVFNPRRVDFPIDDPEAAFEQIQWEWRAMREANQILFWFPMETLCPIVLYELGAWSMTDKNICVGVHPEYARRRDVEIQTGLARPEVNIVYSLEELADQVDQMYGTGKMDYKAALRWMRFNRSCTCARASDAGHKWKWRGSW